MEITLEKIELVKDRTGVTYKEAKEALEQTEGNVVDAIIRLEETVNQKKGFVGAKGENLMAKIKEIVGRGNVSRILVKRDEEVFLNLPLNAGIVGAVVAPWGILAGAIASFGFNCVIEFVKEDGSVIDLTEKAGEYYEVAKEKGQEAYEVIKEKSVEAYDEFQEKAPGVYENLKEKGAEAYETIKEKAPEAMEKGKGLFNQVKEKAGEVKDKASEKFGKYEEDFEILMDDIEDQIEDIEDDIKDALKKEEK